MFRIKLLLLLIICGLSSWSLLFYTNTQWSWEGAPCDSIAFGADPKGDRGKAYCFDVLPRPEMPAYSHTGRHNGSSVGGQILQAVSDNDGDPAYRTDNTLVPSYSSSPTINSRIGKPDRVLIGLGSWNSVPTMQSKGIHPDIIDTYLVGVGSVSWISWNKPAGSYITNTARQAAEIGAIPMYTLYQMAQNGDGNISGIGDSAFMSGYWSQVRLMFQLFGSYGKSVLVNLEPDFWGYVEAQAPDHDPTRLQAAVNLQPECSYLPNTVAGIAQCMLRMARIYAPQTLVGYPASFFGESGPTVAAFMQKIGAQNADFIVAQTVDRDAGCSEVVSPLPECSRHGSGLVYWDETNRSRPNYAQSQVLWTIYRNELGNNLPILWWQTPMGVPSSEPGGNYQHYRDNHVHYMLKHVWQYRNMHSFAIIFSAGASSQTTISTDNGQFQNLFAQYLSHDGNDVH